MRVWAPKTVSRQRCLTASDRAIKADMGSCKVLTGNGERNPDKLPDKLIENLGMTWDIVSPGLVIKLYPSCRSTHPAIDAALYLRKEYNIDVDQVAGVECVTSPLIPQVLLYNKAENGKAYSKKYGVFEATGDPSNPLTQEELFSKYREGAAIALPQAAVQRSLKLASKLETLKDVSELMEVVSAKPLAKTK